MIFVKEGVWQDALRAEGSSRVRQRTSASRERLRASSGERQTERAIGQGHRPHRSAAHVRHYRGLSPRHVLFGGLSRVLAGQRCPEMSPCARHPVLFPQAIRLSCPQTYRTPCISLPVLRSCLPPSRDAHPSSLATSIARYTSPQCLQCCCNCPNPHVNLVRPTA